MSIRDALERDVVRYFSEVAGRTRDHLERDFQRAPPVDTGYLRGHTSVSVRRDGNSRFRFTARADADYASFTSKPTRSHVIRARNAKVLRFFWPKVGHVVYFPSVNHPGTRGTGWWERTLESFPDVVRDSL